MHRASVFAIAALLASLALAVAALLVGTGSFIEPAVRPTGQVDKIDADNFGLSDTSSRPQTTPDLKFRGAVFLDAGDRSAWFGTYVEGDAYTGTATSTPFPLSKSEVQIPVIGYPNSTGNSLALEILDSNGTVVDSIVFRSDNPMEKVAIWNVSVKPWAGHRARLRLTDGLHGMGGWLGVGRPVSYSRWLAEVPTNYWRMIIAVLAIAGLLFIPGAALRTWSTRFPKSFALLPIPGLLMLAGFGLVIACGGMRNLVPLFSMSLLVGLALVSATLGVHWWRCGSPFDSSDRSAFLIYACVCMASLAYAYLPLSGPQRGSHPWNTLIETTPSQRETPLPFAAAIRLLNRGDPSSQESNPSNGTQAPEIRAPFVPLCIVSLLTVFQVNPALPSTASIGAWPMDSGGYFLGRIFGILTQAFVIFGGVCLAALLLPEAWSRTLAWLAVAPVVLLNADFSEPLLLAAFFCTLAVIAVAAGRSAIPAGLACSLAIATHPTASLMVLPVAGLLLHNAAVPINEKSGPRLSVACLRSLLFLAALLPIVALCTLFDSPGNAIAQTVRLITSDGHGIDPASDLGSWLMARVSNAWYTLMPTALFFSPPPEISADSLLSAPLRWIDGYAGSLAGNAGYLAFLFCVAVGAEPGHGLRQRLWRWLFWGALGLMLTLWGGSAGGLGRHGAESLSILLIVVCSCTPGLNDRLWGWLLIAATVEAISLRTIGIFASHPLGSSALSPQTIMLSLIALLGTIIPCIWYLGNEPRLRSCRSSLPSPTAAAS